MNAGDATHHCAGYRRQGYFSRDVDQKDVSSGVSGSKANIEGVGGGGTYCSIVGKNTQKIEIHEGRHGQCQAVLQIFLNCTIENSSDVE